MNEGLCNKHYDLSLVNNKMMFPILRNDTFTSFKLPFYPCNTYNSKNKFKDFKEAASAHSFPSFSSAL